MFSERYVAKVERRSDVSISFDIHDVNEELRGATTLLTAIVHFRDKRLILQVDNTRRHFDTALPFALLSSTKPLLFDGSVYLCCHRQS